MKAVDENDEDISGLTGEVAAATGLREGPKGVEDVLRAIFQMEPAGVKVLARKVRLPVPVLAAVLGELSKRSLVARGEGVSLTQAGRSFVQEELGIHTRAQWTCQGCNGRTIILPARLRPLAEKLAAWSAQAPGVDTSIDQAPSTPESSLRRALFLIQHGAVEGKRVLILGDDDSICLAIGMLGQALYSGGAFAARLAVIESDPRWVEHLHAISSREGLAIEFYQADLRKPLPEALRGQFDTFETDPPYTQAGMALFVSRGVEALASGGGGQGFLSLGAAPPADQLAYQGILQNMGLVVAGLLPNFNVYQGASLLGGTSHLMHLVATEGTLPLFTGAYDENIYTGQKNPVLRVYRCMGCGRTYKLGLGQAYPTIEKLKSVGCEACGSKSFELAARIMRE